MAEVTFTKDQQLIKQSIESPACQAASQPSPKHPDLLSCAQQAFSKLKGQRKLTGKITDYRVQIAGVFVAPSTLWGLDLVSRPPDPLNVKPVSATLSVTGASPKLPSVADFQAVILDPNKYPNAHYSFNSFGLTMNNVPIFDVSQKLEKIGPYTVVFFRTGDPKIVAKPRQFAIAFYVQKKSADFIQIRWDLVRDEFHNQSPAANSVIYPNYYSGLWELDRVKGTIRYEVSIDPGNGLPVSFVPSNLMLKLPNDLLNQNWGLSGLQ